jgi:hypothetical protein
MSFFSPVVRNRFEYALAHDTATSPDLGDLRRTGCAGALHARPEVSRLGPAWMLS